MLLKTHVMFAVLVIILFIQQVNNKFVFIGMVLVATVIPDLDSGFSSYGRHIIFRPLQFFVKHRGVIHSLTAAVVLSVLIALYWPVAGFGFFMGYCVHLVCDSFTREGIQPFWPLKIKSNGVIASGGGVEESLFLGLIVANFLLFFMVFVVGG